MTRLPFRLERNFRVSLLRWVFSMTKMMSAHSTCSDDNGTLAPLEMPAESVSIPGQVEKICSAVGLRRRLACGGLLGGRLGKQGRADGDDAQTGRDYDQA